MKIRIGLITEDKTAQDQIKKDFENIHIYQAPNVMDFYQVVGTNKIDAIVVTGDQKLAKEFPSYYSYIRQKSQFNSTPVAFICSQPLLNNYPISDTLVRSYTMDGGYFMALIDFLRVIQDSQAITKVIDNKKIETIFLKAMSKKVGLGQNFSSRPATDEEAHSEFLIQHSDEIATNLLWVKFSARILMSGSKTLLQLLKSISEEEQSKLAKQIITAVFTEFHAEMVALLNKEGALFFSKSEAIPVAEKTPYLKKSKSQALLFESSYCSFLVEFNRYI